MTRSLLVLAPVLVLGGCDTIDPADGNGSASTVDQGPRNALMITDLVELIDVVTVSGNVQVSVGPDGELSVDKVGTAEDIMGWELDGTTLRLWSECTNGQAGCGAGFVIAMPRSTHALVQTSSGAIDVGSQCIGDLELRTKSGSVTVRGRTGGIDTIETESGAVATDWDVEPRRVDITTISSPVEVKLIPGTYDFDATSNNTVVVDPRIEFGIGPVVRVRTQAGAVTLVAEPAR